MLSLAGPHHHYHYYYRDSRELSDAERSHAFAVCDAMIGSSVQVRVDFAVVVGGVQIVNFVIFA